jgi:hypothetical protein
MGHITSGNVKHHDQFDIHVSVHHDTIKENDQQDATVYDNLVFLGSSTCFERYFRSSSRASKLYYSFWYYTRMSMPAGIMGVLELQVCTLRKM